VLLGGLLASTSSAQCGDELGVIYPSSLVAGRFGYSIAVEGNLAVVGSPNDDDPSHNGGSASVVDLVSMQELRRLVPHDTSNNTNAGRSVDLSGTTAIVGMPGKDDDQGAAYLFDTATGSELFQLLSDDGSPADFFGQSVAIDGPYAIVGAPGNRNEQIHSGSAYVFVVATGMQARELLPPVLGEEDQFGAAVAMHGSQALIGAPGDDGAGDVRLDQGRAFLVHMPTQSLTPLEALDATAGDHFGSAVALNETLAVVAANHDEFPTSPTGSVYVFDAATGVQLTKLLPPDPTSGAFGQSVAVHGTHVLVGDNTVRIDGEIAVGAAYLFDGITGELLSTLIASDWAAFDELGRGVALSGSRALVGCILDDAWANNAGSVYVFDAQHHSYAYCSSNPNSTGSTASISACGSTSLAANDLTLMASPVPDTPYLFFFGANPQETPFGDGFLCTQGSIQRLGPAQTASGNLATRVVDLPSAGITSPGTLRFQCWYRDQAAGGAGFNTSDAVAVVFSP